MPSSTPKTKLGFHNRSQYSNFTFGCRDRRHRGHHDNDIECIEPDDALISQLLEKGSLSCEGVLNDGQEDEMKITGYRRSGVRTAVCWICIFLTGGILRLVMHWWRHWLLLATHSPCPLDVAEKVLIREDYQGKHTLYYVKDITTFNAETYQKMKLKRQKSNNFFPLDNSLMNDNDFRVSLHFASGEFRHLETVRIFRCKQLRYVWDVQTQTFRKLKGLDVNVRSTYLHQRKGLSRAEHYARRLVYGENEITIPVRGVFTLLFLEVLNPFYCFQVFSVCLWISYNYYYYAVVIVIMSAFGITMSIIQTKKNQQALTKTVLNNDNALIVYEDGQVENVETKHLVPGDLIEIPSSGCTMQCDAVLLSGNCILDESMLTGESVPVTKTPLPMKRDLIFDTKEHSRHTLFCGTKVIQTRYFGSEKVLAVVINTGNITAKGGLIRSILYPPPVDYKFEQDSYKFIALLGLIAGVGFVYTLVTKILRAVSGIKIAVESLDLITIAVPPALPAAMTVGRFNAQRRLKRKDIYCISPRSINVSGSIDCVCFDKTGTLTEDGLDMWGVVPKTETNQFQMPLKQIDRLQLNHFLFGMVTCHSITMMNNELKGDPLDLKMFESTGWILEEPNVDDERKFDLLYPTIVKQPKSNRNSVGSNASSASTASKQLNGSDEDLLFGSNDIGIVRQFPFTSNLQRMSVITRKIGDNHFNVYCKGSPEMIETLCKPETIPENYSTQLDYYAQQGYRIIAVAYKPLGKKETYAKIHKIGRDKIECDLEFQGFVILENRLKPDTTQVIKNLTDANIRTVMVTGDNILTAISVAKKCGMVTPKQSIITVNVRQHPENPEKYEIYYNLTGTTGPAVGAQPQSNVQTPNGNGEMYGVGGGVSSVITNSNSVASLETIATWTHRDVELGLTYDDGNNVNSSGDGNKKTKSKLPPADFISNLNNYRFAMVGKTWSIIQEHTPELLKKFVTRGTIFARMSPEHKQALITELQDLGYYVAMCGDGANDCGALKAAHTGISLSEAESSVASPFTSRKPTIACVPDVIKEGRAALVTSFGIFKYMAAYSLVQFVSVLILYSIDSNLTDIQFLYIDLGLISVFAFFFGKTEAYDGPLVKRAPLSSLISLSPILSLILHLIVAIVFQVSGWYHVKSEPWYTPFNLTDTGNDTDLACVENYTIFALSCYQYIILAFVFSKGKPYRKSILSNYMFLFVMIANTLFVIYLTIIPSNFIAQQFELIMPPRDSNFRLYMLGYGVLNFLISLFIESFIIEYVLNKLRYSFHNIEKSRRKYLVIENELRNNYKWPPLSCYQNDLQTMNTEEKQSPVSYAEIGAEHGIDIGQQLIDQNNSVLNRFFDNNHQHNYHNDDDDDEKDHHSLNLVNNVDKINGNNKQIMNGATSVDNDEQDTDDDEDLSNIDSESDYESIQHDLKFNNGSQDNVLATSSSSSSPAVVKIPTTTVSTVIINNNNENIKVTNDYRNELQENVNEQKQQRQQQQKLSENNGGIEMMLNPIKLPIENNHLTNHHQNNDLNHINHHENNVDGDLLLQQTTFNHDDTIIDHSTKDLITNHKNVTNSYTIPSIVPSSSTTAPPTVKLINNLISSINDNGDVPLNVGINNCADKEIKQNNLNNCSANEINTCQIAGKSDANGGNGDTNNCENNYVKQELCQRRNYNS